MKQVSNDYKNAIIDLGRQYDVKITYGSTTLTNEQLNQVTPHYRSDLLKSVMKQLDLDSNVDIPIGTEINCQFGLKVGNSYEYIDYGNYIVYSSEKQEDLLSYRIVCYDKMLYAMKDYEDLEITYPISIKDYISAIATKIGLQFEEEDFTNADKEIPEEKYLDEDGNTLGYTYRDVLDELAQVTASIIKVEDNKLRITYPDDVIKETGTFESTSGQITTDSKKVLDLEVEGNTYQEQTSGKNLFNINDTPGQIQNTTKTVADQTISVTRTPGITATAYMSFKLVLEANTNYYVSGIAKVTNTDLTGPCGIYIRQDRGSGTVLGSQTLLIDTTNNQTIGFSFNSGSNTTAYIWLYVDNVPNESSSTGTRTLACTNLQVEKGSSATSYEKFTYGPTPNPDYPQPIQVATGNQEIDVVGKNLFTTGNGTSSRIGVNATYNGSEVVLNGTTTSAGNIFYDETISINTGYRKSQTLPAGTYTLSTKTTGTATYPSGTGIGIYIRDGNGNILKSFSSIANYQTTLTLNSETIIYSQLYINGSGGVYNNYTIYFQIEKGIATTYEPYIGNTYSINLGKNLFDSSLISDYTTSTGITISHNEDGIIVLNGTASSQTNINTAKINIPMGLKEIAISGGSANVSFAVNTYTSDDTYIGVKRDSGTPQIYSLPSNASKYEFNIRIASGTSLDNYVVKAQVEKGSVATSFSPYFTPIELCKINDYRDRIFKSSGKNLLNPADLQQGGLDLGGSGIATASTTRIRTDFIEVKPNTTYTISRGNTIISHCGIGLYKDDESYDSSHKINSGGWCDFPYIITTQSDTKYLRFSFKASDTTITPTGDYKLQLEENNQATSYEPYGIKGKWYIEKYIGKVVLDGTETGWSFTNSSGKMIHYRQITGKIAQKILMYSNYFKYSVNEWQLINNYEFCTQANQYIFIRDDDKTSSSDFKTWLGTHNTIVYYILATPTYTEITNQELINQLNSIELLDGLNNISITSSNLSSPLKMSYISEYETITEDYLKDVNVNFSEKFGPVNSLVLSRSADSDLIYRKDDSSIEKNGLTEIKISDNQILNGNDRDEYIDNIFNRLKGIEYYTNDYDSTGITYLDLGDFYKVEARGNRYLALMLNDELNVTQGFEELIHTDKPDTSVSDYKKADTTDRRINKATLIVDKQNQTIQALTSRTSNLESKQINDKAELLAKFGDYALDSRVDDITTQVETLQTDTYTKTEVKSILKGTFYDSDNNQIVSEVVKTTSGTFDENGMHYEKTNAKTKSTINEVGVRVDNAINDSELLFAGYDDNINQTIVRTDNLTVRNFLVVGSQSRFQDYEENNEQGTGVFDL